MLNRILTSLDSPRRHLGFLVLLLVLVFALSGVVAYRAMEAERSRSQAVEDVIERGIERAAAEWASLYYNGLTYTMNEIALQAITPTVDSAQLRAETVAERVSPLLMCVYCRIPPSIDGVAVVDLPTRQIESSTGHVNMEVVHAAIDMMLTDTSAVFTDRLHGILYHGRNSGELRTVLLFGLRDDDRGAVRHAIAIALTSESAIALLEGTFAKAQQLTGSAVVVEQVDSLYDRAAYVGGAQVMGDTVDGGSFNRTEPPIHGVEFRVGLRDAYAEGAYDSATKLIAIVGLLVLIGGLLVIAAVQIRRETVLMRMRADFVSSVSHELRTPLAQIRMFVETLLLGRTRTDLERQRSLEIIEQEARRLAHLVENVLLFSKTEGGRRPRIAPEPTDFAGDIRRAVDSFSLLSRARDAELRTELQENITVQVDRGALRQILINLIDNALKYGPAGQRVTVGAALFDDVARVWVDDEGPGIPEDARARVFDSFYRLPRERQKHVAGSGIGLSVVRELARLHGGDVWAEDAPGRGARIVVQFPDAYLRSETAGAMAAAS